MTFQDGYENAFEDIGEIGETVKTGVWVGDCFIFTNALNRLNYFVGGEIVTVAHLERPLYLLGYLPEGLCALSSNVCYRTSRSNLKCLMRLIVW